MTKTSKEIAEICGVSRGTVDRALNDRPGINPATKEKILKVAEALGYKPHFLAQSLVKGKTMSIGAVLFDINNRVFPQLINTIEERLREKGYFLYLTLSNKKQDVEMECIKHLADRKVDGLILLSVNKSREFTQFLNRLQIPIVTFANFISPLFPYLWIDDRAAIKDAVGHLVSKRYESIIYLSPPLALRGKTNLYAIEQRYNGFQEATKHLDVESIVIQEKNYMPKIYEILEKNSKRKAILCTSDIYAINILMDFLQKGIKVPDDVGIMGFDNIDILKLATPGISTIGYSTEELGGQIVETLTDLIHGQKPASEFLLGHQIIERQSL